MKLAFLGNFTIDFIVKEYNADQQSEIYVSGYNQYQLDILNPESEYYKFHPEFTILLLDGDTFFKNRNLEEVKTEILNLFSENNKKLNNYFIISNIYLFNESNPVIRYNLNNNIKKLQSEFNLFLNELAVKNQNLFVLDVLSIIEKYGQDSLYDNSMWIYAKNRYCKKGIKEISRKIKILLNAILDVTKKCLVLDLDNTLWGGVIGEDGIEGIKLGTDNFGELFVEFQKKLLEIKKKGIILTICSKNNEQDVIEVFEKHKYMLIKLNDFVVKKINWLSKDQNIKEIAHELNIGEDSLVFIDDSKFERELVRNKTTAIVPEFPKNVEDLLDFIISVDEEYFSKLIITDEDNSKTEQYIQNIKRTELEKSSTTIEEFVKSLQMELKISPAKKETLGRIAQLTQKTNQFNFTTTRYSEKDIESIINDSTYKIFTGSVKDKFGDHGLVILVIIRMVKDEAIIDTFLMSCRVIGRFIENAFIYEIINNINCEKIIGRYIHTQKNELVSKKYDELGFKLVKIDEDNNLKEYITYKTDLKSNNLVKVTYEE